MRAWRDDAEVALGPRQQRAVLAVLLLNNGSLVSVNQFIDALWGGHPPTTAPALVRTYITGLRRALSPADCPIRTQSASYGLSVPVQSVDVERVRQLVSLAQETRDPGDRVAAATRLREEPGLWSGIPLSDLDNSFAVALRSSLEELRLLGAEECAAADIESGRHAAATAELVGLAAAHPLRERLHELLMLALYRSGRQAEALAAYGNVRTLLQEELGVDPGPELQTLHQQILQADRRLFSSQGRDSHRTGSQAQAAVSDEDPTENVDPPPRPAQLPKDMALFVARSRELAYLDTLLPGPDSTDDAVTVATIDGSPGTGKSTLAVRWAHRAAHHFPDGQLYIDLKGFSGTRALHPADIQKDFLHALGVRPDSMPPAGDQRTGLYRSVLSNKHVLLVLDNARDADQVRILLPAAQGCRAVVTSRNRLPSLVAGEGAYPLTLGLLDPDDARESFTRRIGPARSEAEPQAVDEITELCSRLPLAIAVVAARAQAHPHFPLAAIAAELQSTRGSLDAFTSDDSTDVRTAFSWSYHQLTAPARRMLRMLSLAHAPDISTAAVASLTATPLRPARALTIELSRAQMISEPHPGRFTLHDLLRAYALELSEDEDSGAECAAALGRLFDHYRHSAYSAHLQLRPHNPAPPPPAPRGGTQPETPHDLDTARAWFDTERLVLAATVEHAADLGAAGYAWQLALSLALHYQRSGRYFDWATTMRLALTAAERAGDRVGQAHMHRSLAGARHYLGDTDQALVHLRHAHTLFADLGYKRERAYVHSNFATVLADQGHYRQAEKHHRQALEFYRQDHHRAGEANALEGIGECRTALGQHAEAIELVQEALDLYQLLDDRNGQAVCWSSLGDAHTALAHLEQADEFYQRALSIDVELGNRANQGEELLLMGNVRLAMGEGDSARRCWVQALAIMDELKHPKAVLVRQKIASV
ncbi:AfsR/SARP family transcriptional regulator [Streptomyces sp. SID1121]|uniref:AfsR/SARP family transcriptional regulator n=1 Tax=Streptomyces sp. SID1121 TaxID=3425888 RepID=UPI004056BF5E